jgi:hypothetical protein
MGRMLRPKMQVLPDSAMVDPATTHIVSGEQPYFLKRPGKVSEPAGTLHAGSQVRLVSKGRGEMSVVQDAEGRQVYTAFAGLRPIR